MKKILAAILFLTSAHHIPAASAPSLPWKLAAQLGGLAYMIVPNILSLYHARHEDYKPLAVREIVPFIDEQLRQHGFNPASVKLFYRRGDQINAAATLGGNLIIDGGLANQIYEGIKNNPDPTTNPALGEAAMTIAHECGHLKGYHCAASNIFSILSIPALWLGYNKLISKGEEYLKTKINNSMENGVLKTTLSWLNEATAFALPFAATWATHRVLFMTLARWQEYRADTYALTHAPSPLALCASAAFFSDPSKQAYWSQMSLFAYLWRADHPTNLSRANRALAYAQKMLKAQAAAAA